MRFAKRILNFDLITAMPSPPSLSSVSRRDGVAVSPSATRRSLAAPQPSPHPWCLPGASRTATRRRPRHARRGWTSKRHDDAVQRQPTAPRLLPRLFPPLWPVQQTCSTPLHSFPFLQSRAEFFLAPGSSPSRHGCRRPRPPRGAPSSALPRPEPPLGTSPSRLTGAP